MSDKPLLRDEVRKWFELAREPIPSRIKKMSIKELEVTLEKLKLRHPVLFSNAPKPEQEPKRSRAKVDDLIRYFINALLMYSKVKYLRLKGDDENTIQRYKQNGDDYIRKVINSTVDKDGKGYGIGSSVLSIIDDALTMVHREFTNSLVEDTILTTILSEKHNIELAKQLDKKDGKEKCSNN